ncbi:MAG: ATP-binding protein, partial [Acidobacteriota bacterium]|nr:ATP-binding protein [Acidobacteriota bacterium]
MAALDRNSTRVCLIGAECTGKTTLAARLAGRFAAPWVPEYVREYAERVGRPLTFDDVDQIAVGQIAIEDAVDASSMLVILDTDLISTVVYSRHHYGDCPEWVVAEAQARRADLYLFTDIDMPWTADDVRDSGARREALHAEFALALAAFEARVAVIRGDWES